MKYHAEFAGALVGIFLTLAVILMVIGAVIGAGVASFCLFVGFC